MPSHNNKDKKTPNGKREICKFITTAPDKKPDKKRLKEITKPLRPKVIAYEEKKAWRRMVRDERREMIAQAEFEMVEAGCSRGMVEKARTQERGQRRMVREMGRFDEFGRE